MLKITDSKVFQSINNTNVTNSSLLDGLTSLHSKGITDGKTLVTANTCDIMNYMFVVKDRVQPAKMPCKKEIKDLLNSNMIRLVYDKTNNLGKTAYGMPWALQGDHHGNVGVTINASAFFSSKQDFDGNGTVTSYTIENDNKLVEILNVAYTLIKTSDKFAKLNINAPVKRQLMDLYAEMMLFVLVKQSTISADKQVVKTIRYYINNFFSRALLKLDVEEVFSQFSATVAGLNDTEKLVADEKRRQSGIGGTAYDDIESFLGFLRTAYPNIGDLTISNLIRKYSVYFDSSAVLAIDYLPYLCALLVSGATDCSAIGNTTFKKQFSSIIKINSLKLLQMYNGD